MDKKENPAVESLRAIGMTSNKTVRNIYDLVIQAFRGDARLQEELVKKRALEVQYDQIKLSKMQIANELILNQLLAFKLKRKLRIRRFFGLIKTPKP